MNKTNLKIPNFPFSLLPQGFKIRTLGYVQDQDLPFSLGVSFMMVKMMVMMIA
jgi:hypothetical protein